MNTIPRDWTFDARVAPHAIHAPTNAVMPGLPALAKHLAKVEPWLANRPEFIPVTPLAAMEWPDDAIARFNHDVVSHRLARIGTALAAPAAPDAEETPVQAMLQRAHFHALLVRHQTHVLAGTALDTANALHQKLREQPLGRDVTPMNRWLDMRPHYFGKTERVYGEAMADWAQNGVPREAFQQGGAMR